MSGDLLLACTWVVTQQDIDLSQEILKSDQMNWKERDKPNTQNFGVVSIDIYSWKVLWN